MSATRKRLRGKSEKPVESESARSLRDLEAFLSRTPRIIWSLLCHTSIEESCIGAPVFFQAPSSLVRKLPDLSIVEKRLVAVETREIRGLRSRYDLQSRAQRLQLLTGLLYGFSHRELRISHMSWDEYCERADDRLIDTEYFVPGNGRWRRANQRETRRCRGLADVGRAPFAGLFYRVPRWALCARSSQPSSILGCPASKSDRVYVHTSEEARRADPRTGIHLLVEPSTLIVSRAKGRGKRGFSDFHLELDSGATARQAGLMIAKSLGIAPLPKPPKSRRVDPAVEILWPSAIANERVFHERTQFVK